MLLDRGVAVALGPRQGKGGRVGTDGRMTDWDGVMVKRLG